MQTESFLLRGEGTWNASLNIKLKLFTSQSNFNLCFKVAAHCSRTKVIQLNAEIRRIARPSIPCVHNKPETLCSVSIKAIVTSARHVPSRCHGGVATVAQRNSRGCPFHDGDVKCEKKKGKTTNHFRTQNFMASPCLSRNKFRGSEQ